MKDKTNLLTWLGGVLLCILLHCLEMTYFHLANGLFLKPYPIDVFVKRALALHCNNLLLLQGEYIHVVIFCANDN